MGSHFQQVRSHYTCLWASTPASKVLTAGPLGDLPPEFCVLEFPPWGHRHMWTYATACMSQPSDVSLLELHLFSPEQHDSHVELMTAIAHYHRTGSKLGLGHSVNFGRPWMPDSDCTFGLISLPYLDGPSLEICSGKSGFKDVRFLWLVPITEQERDYKRSHGLEALELAFEAKNVNYIDPMRRSVV